MSYDDYNDGEVTQALADVYLADVYTAPQIQRILAIVKKRLDLDASLYTLLQVLSVTLFEKMPIYQALAIDRFGVRGSGEKHLFSQVGYGTRFEPLRSDCEDGKAVMAYSTSSDVPIVGTVTRVAAACGAIGPPGRTESQVGGEGGASANALRTTIPETGTIKGLESPHP